MISRKELLKLIQPKASVCNGCALRKFCVKEWEKHPSFSCNGLKSIERVLEKCEEKEVKD
jgi:hypothetical protein